MSCLFKVRRKSTGEIVPVYGVKTERFLEFLIYSRNMSDSSRGRWVYALADRFEPIEEQETNTFRIETETNYDDFVKHLASL